MRFALALIIALGCSGPVQAQEASAPAPARPAQDPDLTAANEAFGNEDWPGAEKAYKAFLAKGRNAPIAHFRLGYALHMQKKFDEALTHHLKAVPITNRAIRIDALYNCACANALLGKKEEALKYLQHAIDAGFADKEQVGKDSDVDSLREDPTFKKLVAGIGNVPRLDQQLDSLLGTWIMQSDKGETTQTFTFSRPLPGSQGIVTTVTNRGGSRTGLLVPQAAERTWMWTVVDGLGTVQVMKGKAIEGAVQFEGRDSFMGTDGPKLRVTLTPGEDAIVEKVEVSDDGKAWRTHHEDRHVKKPAGG